MTENVLQIRKILNELSPADRMATLVTISAAAINDISPELRDQLTEEFCEQVRFSVDNLMGFRRSREIH